MMARRLRAETDPPGSVAENRPDISGIKESEEMNMYNYLEAMKEDVKTAILDNYNLKDFESRDELEERLNDDLWIDDSVTGNASGSYTCNAYRAAEYVQEDGEEYVRELISEFGLDAETVANHLFDYEYWDVSIRCYLLGQAISEALDDMSEELENAFNTEGSEEERIPA